MKSSQKTRQPLKPKKPQSNKSVKPAPVNIDKPEAYKLPDEITYKGIAFKVRQNRIGVGKQISDLSAMLKDDIYINQLFIARTPEFSEYMTVLSAVQQIAIDLRAQEQKLKDSDPRQKKALQQVIDKIKSDYNTEYKRLLDPKLANTYIRYNEIKRELYSAFINDNIKPACEAVLLGDLTQIQFDNPDKDLEQLRDGVFAVFFSLSSRIYS